MVRLPATLVWSIVIAFRLLHVPAPLYQENKLTTEKLAVMEAGALMVKV